MNFPQQDKLNEESLKFHSDRVKQYSSLALFCLIAPFLLILYFSEELNSKFGVILLVVLFVIPFLYFSQIARNAKENLEHLKEKIIEENLENVEGSKTLMKS